MQIKSMLGFSKKQSDTPRRRFSTGDVSSRADKPTAESLEQRYAFRRNRTITGSSSSDIHSANDHSADLKSPRVKAHELAHKRRRLGFGLLGVLAACMLLVVVITQFTAQVIIESNRDASIRLDPKYEQLVDTYFGKYPAERIRVFLDEEKLLAFLQADAPEILKIKQQSSVGFGKTSFAVTVRQPVVSWNLDGKQRFVDANGVSFAKNYFTTPPVQIIDKSGIQVSDGRTIASNRFLGFIGRAIGAMGSHNLNVQSVEIPNRTTRQIKVKVKDVSYPILMSVDRSAGEQAEDAARAIDWMKRHDTNPTYLDVRVSRRAFYRT